MWLAYILLGIVLIPTFPVWIAVCGIGWLVSLIIGVPTAMIVARLRNQPPE
jgi:hypothetical protein